MTTVYKYILTLVLLLAGALAAWADGGFVLVIDAGHGGHDSGAVGSFSKEKNINLSVALAFGRLVEQNCKDVKVVYTRKTDVFVTLDGRAAIANKAKADLFISVHTNALPEGRIAYGSETYTLGMHRAASNLEVAKRENSVISYESNYQTKYEGFDPNKAESYVIFEFMQDKFMKQSVDLASCIQKQYVRSGRRDKGVHQAGFLVLRKTSMPAVLTELGFITTPDEERYLNSDEGVRALAGSLYNGFLEYRRQHGAKNLPAPLKVEKAVAEKADNRCEDADEPVVEPVNYTLAENKVPAPAAEKPAKPQPAAEPKKPAAKAASEKADKKPAPAVEPKKPAAKAAPEKTEKKTTAVQNAKKPAADKKAEPAKASGAKKPAQNTEAKKPAARDVAAKTPAAKETVFRIQFAASGTPIAPNDKRYKGLPAVTSEKAGGMYRHLCGNYKTRAEAAKALKEISQKYPGAFIVTYVDGKRK